MDGWMDVRNTHEKRKESLGEVMEPTSPQSVLITVMIMTIIYDFLPGTSITPLSFNKSYWG